MQGRGRAVQGLRAYPAARRGCGAGGLRQHNYPDATGDFHEWPDLSIPLSLKPKEGEAVDDLPRGKGWLYEPKYDGFRSLSATATSRSAIQKAEIAQPILPKCVPATPD